jgi:cell division protein ZapA
MSKVSLKIEIAGRTYPITVKETEKEKVESAAKKINDAVDMLKKNYAVNDSQDLLAMSALQLLMKTPTSSASTHEAIESQLNDLENEVSSWL